MNYIKDFLEINSEELNEEIIESLLFLSVAVLSEIILEKLHFEKNKDLKEFTTEVLLESYKDYLFDSRPTLYARIIKDLRSYKKENKAHFMQLERNIQNFLSIKYKRDVNPQNKKSIRSDEEKKLKSGNKEVIEGWRSIIES
ncbi:hypothetical protein [Rossellomorea arthrocnemi]|uniref:hypothetical protein n=1 Tax=Rossellomorea arthrocnemi TaxID=2769542 RepID=UPI00191B52FB|nr:hypothetical protein [Rossellomorea arthrocnemi]